MAPLRALGRGFTFNIGVSHKSFPIWSFIPNVSPKSYAAVKCKYGLDYNRIMLKSQSSVLTSDPQKADLIEKKVACSGIFGLLFIYTYYNAINQ